MIDIKKAQANQTTIKGINEDWVVTLDGEQIYTLPAVLSPDETFKVRDGLANVIEMVRAEERTKYDNEIAKIVEGGDKLLDALESENQRLSEALERLMLETEVA